MTAHDVIRFPEVSGRSPATLTSRRPTPAALERMPVDTRRRAITSRYLELGQWLAEADRLGDCDRSAEIRAAVALEYELICEAERVLRRRCAL